MPLLMVMTVLKVYHNNNIRNVALKGRESQIGRFYEYLCDSLILILSLGMVKKHLITYEGGFLPSTFSIIPASVAKWAHNTCIPANALRNTRLAMPAFFSLPKKIIVIPDKNTFFHIYSLRQILRK